MRATFPAEALSTRSMPRRMWSGTFGRATVTPRPENERGKRRRGGRVLSCPRRSGRRPVGQRSSGRSDRRTRSAFTHAPGLRPRRAQRRVRPESESRPAGERKGGVVGRAGPSTRFRAASIDEWIARTARSAFGSAFNVVVALVAPLRCLTTPRGGRG